VEDFVTSELVFMTIAGSKMYGTSTPQSDTDKRGVCVPPKNVVMGFARSFNEQQVPGEDTTIFALMKFMALVTENNPNIMELLYAPDDCILTTSPTWEKLRERRDAFLSAKCYHTFTGYAHNQLKRIRSHREWLRDPPTHKPTRVEFGLGESGQGVRELSRGIDVAEISKDAMLVIEREKQHKAALTRWNQYQEWKETRNPARAELEAKYGFDTKHAAHLVRLLRMGHEVLTQGKLIVRRPDAEELLAIRRGCYSYDQLMEMVDALGASLDKIYEEKSYVVPFSPPKTDISDFAVELHDYHWAHHAKR
jgi:hypothetical protein